jgi:hypothetical protein
MSGKKKGRRATLADELDATRWDYQPGKDGKILLRPVGSVFKDVPWEIEPQYLGPAPVAETELEDDTDTDNDEDVDTQPLQPLKR